MFGVVPAASSVKGPTGYFGNGSLFSGQQRGEGADEERESLLHRPPSSDAAAPKQQGGLGSIAAGGAGSSSATVAADRASSSLHQPPPPGPPSASPRGGAGGAGGRRSSPGLGPPPAAAAAAPSRSKPPGRSPSPSPAPGGGAAGDSAAAAQQQGGGGPSPKSRCPFESLDYELIENTVYRTDAAASTHTDHILRGAVKWSLCFALGVITAAAAFAVNFGVENIAGLKFWATLSLLAAGRPAAALALYACINAALVAGAAALTLGVAPAAAGSGIAEVKAYLNGIDVPRIFLAQTLAVKLLGSVGAVAGGLAVGKEGPFVHAGACLGALLSQGGSPERHVGWFKRFWNDRDRADMVACGAAAGVAAAFRAPVGGVLFALEEVTSWFRNQLLWYAFFTTAVVSVAVRSLMRLCQSSEGGGSGCGFFGSGGYLLYEITEGQDNFAALELAPVLLLGVIGGLAGAAFTWLNAQLAAWRRAVLLPHGPRARLWEALAAALLTSALSFLLPLLAPCQPCPPDAGGGCARHDSGHGANLLDLGCPPGSGRYNDLASLFFATQDDAIRSLFRPRTRAAYSPGALLAFGGLSYALAVLSYGLALPTGLFVPSILCGAAYGRLVGVFVARLSPLLGGGLGPGPGATGAAGSGLAGSGGGGLGGRGIDEGTYALLGAASFLGGCMRMSVASCVMLLELTNNLALLPLMMLVTLVAKAVGDGTGVAPIYDSLLSLKRLPYLGPSPPALARHMTAAEAAGAPPATFQRVERVATIVDTLRRTRHNGFAVIGRGPEGEQHILGLVLRSQLAVLLRSRRCFQPTSFVSEVAGRVAFSYQGSDFATPIGGAAGPDVSLTGLALTDTEAGMFLDLGPYVNPSYYVVQEDTSLSKVYTLFRSLGLRHVAVIPRAPAVVGVITRHDLTPEALQASGGADGAPLGAGAAGLASALRGTVRQALDAYQSHHPSSSSSHHPGAGLSASHLRHSGSGGTSLGQLRTALGAGDAQLPPSPRLHWGGGGAGAAGGGGGGGGVQLQPLSRLGHAPAPAAAAAGGSRPGSASLGAAPAPSSGSARRARQAPPAGAAPLQAALAGSGGGAAAAAAAAAASRPGAGLAARGSGRSSSSSASSWSDFDAVDGAAAASAAGSSGGGGGGERPNGLPASLPQPR